MKTMTPTRWKIVRCKGDKYPTATTVKNKEGTRSGMSTTAAAGVGKRGRDEENEEEREEDNGTESESKLRIKIEIDLQIRFPNGSSLRFSLLNPHSFD